MLSSFESKRKMKTVFITRTKSKKDFDDDLKELVHEVKLSGIQDIYILSNFEDHDCTMSSIQVIAVKDEDPTSPISINTVLNAVKDSKKNPDTFLVSSKEVGLKKKHIKALIEELNKNKNLLVVGYKFEIINESDVIDEKLNNELQGYYANKNLVAYKIPWNTCAVWNYESFDKHVSKFDEITNRNPFNPVCVAIDGECNKTEHKGMEDGLAIAQAVSKKPSLKYKLIDKNFLSWKIKTDKKQSHREKLARKDSVLRDFMALRNYSVNDLVSADIYHK